MLLGLQRAQLLVSLLLYWPGTRGKTPAIDITTRASAHTAFCSAPSDGKTDFLPERQSRPRLTACHTMEWAAKKYGSLTPGGKNFTHFVTHDYRPRCKPQGKPALITYLVIFFALCSASHRLVFFSGQCFALRSDKLPEQRPRHVLSRRGNSLHP